MGDPIEGEVIVPNNSLVSITTAMQDNQTLLLSKGQAEGFLINLRTDVGYHLDKIASKVKEVKQGALAMAITTDDQLVNANQFLVDLAPCIKRATEYKDTITKQIKSHTKDIDNLFKSIIDPLTEASTTIRNKTILYRQQQRQAAEEVARILAESGVKDEPQPITTTPPPVTESKSVRVDGGQVSYTPTWTFEITDINEVPIEHLRTACCTSRGREALESIIRNIVKGGVRKMAGVRIFESEQTTVRK